MSATGRYVVTEVTNDLPTSNAAFRNRIDIYVRQTHTFGTVVERPDVFPGPISGDGNHLSLYSSAADLVTPDTTGVTDAFMWTRS